MTKRHLLIAPLLVALLSSCTGGSPSLSAYVKSLNVFGDKDAAHILHLSDIHWSAATNYAVEEAYLTKLVNAAKEKAGGTLDFIQITGDLFLTANQTTVNRLFDLLESFQIPWGMSAGNHDQQGNYGPYYVANQAMARAHCYYQNINDNVYGESNYVVNLTDGTKTYWQLYSLDSNSLYPNGLTYQYDIIHEDQIRWYASEVSKAKEENEDTVVPSLMFFHIPLWQWEYAYKASVSTPEKFYHGGAMYDKVFSNAPSELSGTRTYPGYKDSGLFATAEALGSTKGMFCGHDHSNSFYSMYGTSENRDNDILLAYCIKSGHGLDYHTYQDGDTLAEGAKVGDDMIGGNLITIHKDGSFKPSSGDFNQLVVQY